MKIMCADYLDILSNVESESVSLVLTDPPYGVNYQNPYTTDKHNVLEGDGGDFSYAQLASQSFRVLKPNTCILAFTGWSVYPSHFNDVKCAGFKMKEPLICQKRASGTTDLYGSFQPTSDWVLFAHKGRFVFRQTELLRNARAGTIPNIGRKPVPEFKRRFPSTWFGEQYPYSSENSSFQRVNDLKHPTIKGQKFLEWLIQLTTDVGDLVCDPFVGSGSVAAACKATGRDFVGGDVKQEFVEMTLRRLVS